MADNPIIGFVNDIREVDVPPSALPDAVAADSQAPVHISIVSLRIPEGADPLDSEALLDPRNDSSVRNARLLAGLQRIDAPAFVERTADRVITNVLTPMLGRVVAIRESRDGRLRVQIDGSSASHYIRPSPETEASIALLRSSRDHGDVLLVTEDRRKTQIVDVRPCPPEWVMPPPAAGGPSGESPPLVEPDPVKKLATKPIARITASFEAIRQHSCSANGSAAGCVPFLWAMDGCMPRAHRMCELLESAQIPSEKVWVYANTDELQPSTPNLEACHANWELHVAPIVRATETGELMVIDPSIFDGPVSVDTFVNAMNSPFPHVVFTSRAIFSRLDVSSEGRTEVMVANRKGMREMEIALERFRGELEDMEPPPPFAHCPVD